MRRLTFPLILEHASDKVCFFFPSFSWWISFDCELGQGAPNKCTNDEKLFFFISVPKVRFKCEKFRGTTPLRPIFPSQRKPLTVSQCDFLRLEKGVCNRVCVTCVTIRFLYASRLWWDVFYDVIDCCEYQIVRCIWRVGVFFLAIVLKWFMMQSTSYNIHVSIWCFSISYVQFISRCFWSQTFSLTQ